MLITEDIIQKLIKENELDFHPTQRKLSLPIINRIYKKMISEIKFEVIKVNDKLIIDGHHRYISARLAKIEIGHAKYPKSSATIGFSWNEVAFVNEEWDTLIKIQHLNKLDAIYNNLTLKKIIEIAR